MSTYLLLHLSYCVPATVVHVVLTYLYAAYGVYGTYSLLVVILTVVIKTSVSTQIPRYVIQ